MLKKFFKQKGQALVFFAIAVPTLFMCVAAAIDFGWWYVNQSRLQNAADAAVLAGADKIISVVGNDASNITFKVDFVNKVSSDYPASQDATAGDEVAKIYADKNFKYLDAAADTENMPPVYYNSFQHYTYGDMEKFNPVYYVVELQGKAQHLFGILDRFGDMNLKAVAVAKITENIESIINGLKVKNVMIGNWEVQNIYQKINIKLRTVTLYIQINRTVKNFKTPAVTKHFLPANGTITRSRIKKFTISKTMNLDMKLLTFTLQEI